MTGDEQATISGRTVSAATVVAAPPEEVFALLANPHRHHEFDGSGTVRGAVSGPERLALGDRFGMSMKIKLPYRITNRVVELEPDRRIGWCHAAKAVWRYELEPVPGGTRVTETFDYTASPVAKGMELLGFPKGNAKSIRDTLRRLREIFGTP
ncbi:SRPBCC family protein [Pseudonocardia kunmingensis]|uniref:Polyketide cyclase/dehydrase/lipid transport protein n=1 Tax=Pseudonocardia kunmingensis TaxID=630975 RepID=A0A543DYP1_9PSEU|nr:SRPBCC family protein [Pseudonocardia kunmingensis]TQM14451.1 polyketide cyclase/dehydrase/lipid transport protein [Pseudonocardia kunmingensis]